jgi:DNA helicase IV
MAHPDVPAEQAHVELAYRRLAEMRASAQSMLEDAFGEKGGTFQAVTERDIRVRTSLGRLEHLQLGRESLVFGRIDRAGPDSTSEAFHIGRLAISDRNQEPVVVDWRAPIAEPFYRATGAHPMGLLLRRHFLTEGPTVLDLEDELFDPEGDNSGRGLGLSGPQVLISTLERSRIGRMRDIVATVQREQDEIIRAPLPGILVVQGGPGTGKTAVALHRAAYLLYTHRFPLESQGVLVLGPNPTFLRYIEHVLPSLDETGVELSTVNGLYNHTRAARPDEDSTARLKGDARMARVIARAVGDRERPLRQMAEVPYGRRVLRLTPALTAQLVAAVKRRPGTHNSRRRTLEQVLWRHLAEQLSEESADGRTPDNISAEDLGRELRRQPTMAEALERMWPVLTPEQLLHDLFGARPLIELASSGILNGTEQSLLYRQRGAVDDPIVWTDADIPLLDEGFALLGPRRKATADRAEGIRTYGHVVVDETQDLSPMQLRMVARRSLSGSMTVVGDVAQATGPWAPSSWSQIVEHLPARRGWQLVELTVNYRTPKEIMELAARVLEQVAPGMRSPDSVRATGRPARVVRAERPEGFGRADRLVEAAVSTLIQELDEQPGGTAAVIVPPSLADDMAQSLTDHEVEFGTAGRDALDLPVTVLTVDDAKGLEFDNVMVVEPVRLVNESPQSLRALYVAFTRATQRLTIVHSDPLPAALAGVSQHSA